MAKIDITTAGHTIIVEDDNATLDAVALKALELWWATRDPKLDRGFGVSGMATDMTATGVWVPEFGAEIGRQR